MKVLHLIDSAGIYGAEVVLLHLMAEQKKQGMEVILGSIGKPEISEKNIETAARQRDINVEKFRMMNGPSILGAISIIRFAKQHQINVIHCHGYKANILLGMVPAYFREIPYLVTLHGWTSVKKLSRMWFYGQVDALFIRRADKVVVVSDAMLMHPSILEAGLNPVVVHNGIPPMSRKNISHKQLNEFCTDRFTIGAIGRLSHEKGFSYLINAVANVINRGHDVSLVIIGDVFGDKRTWQELKDIIHRRGISDKVLFTGYLDQANQYLNYFDIFVISSLTEGLPITLLEAMQAGIPIIGTKVGGVPEALNNGKCGLLVNPEDEQPLAAAIIKLYNSPQLRIQLSAAAKQQVKNEFSAKKMESGYRKIYNKLLQTDS